MNPLNYMRLHDYSSRNSRQHWINASNGKIRHLRSRSSIAAGVGDDAYFPQWRGKARRELCIAVGIHLVNFTHQLLNGQTVQLLHRHHGSAPPRSPERIFPPKPQILNYRMHKSDEALLVREEEARASL